MTKQPRLFEPPPKPKPRLCDEEIAVKVVNKLIDLAVNRWHFDRDEFSEQDRIDLAEGLMTTNSDDWKKILDWVYDKRKSSEWKWEDKGMLLEHGLKEACESVLPAMKRGEA